MLKRLLSSVVITCVAASAFAHGPTPRKVEQTVTIAASPAEVWVQFGDFANLAAWHPLVTESVGSGGNEAGAERTVTLKSGGQIVDSLDNYDEAAHTYSYRLMKENIEAFPVSFYTATLTVKSAGDGHSEVTWTGRFYRGDTRNDPPENLSDEAATTAMTEFFRVGLEGLKAKMEGP